MHMSEVRERARAAGLTSAGRVRKAELIRAIQRAEKNPECFGTRTASACPEQNCCWRQDCLTRTPS